MAKDVKMPNEKDANWKAPGPGNVQGCWFPLQDKLVVYLQNYLDSEVVPDWLKKGQTVLIQKDKTKVIANCKQLLTYYMLSLSMKVIARYISR